MQPDIVVLCEIKSVSSEFIRKYFKNLGYDILLKQAAGIVIAAKTKFNMVNVTKTLHDNILSSSVKVGSTQISITAVYGLQESDKIDKRTEFFDEMSIEAQAALDRTNQSIIVGDFNAKLAMNDKEL